MTGFNEQTKIAPLSIADVAFKSSATIRIIKKHTLDYCHTSARSLTDACGKDRTDPLLVIHEILGRRLNIAFDNKIDFSSWDLRLIIDFIEQHHHRYLRSTIPGINDLLERLCNDHADDGPALPFIRNTFHALGQELLRLLDKEEKELFPLIARLNVVTIGADLMDICTSIVKMEHEQDNARRLIEVIRISSKCYTPPVDACPAYKMIFLKLSFLDDDLVQHLQIENSILFPRVKALALALLKEKT